ncbi:hypothetical protein VTK56DRAFT_9708 [Thermocarpiscus australiensis]
MSAPLTDEEREEYTRIIDDILANADLQTVTRKNIRKGLEEAINRDLSDQKDAIKSLIEARFDAVSSKVANSSAAAEASPENEANGHPPSDADDTGIDGEIEVSIAPARKKRKSESLSEDADARLAAELQAEENRLSRGRVTRGAGATKPKPKPKAAKKKSAKRARSDDESDADDAEDKPKRKAGGGFQKPLNLSYPLAELCGESQLSRPQVVKKLWDYIKANGLQDPSNRRQIVCDEKLHAVFKQDKINMFSMNKLLGSQLYPIEEEAQ